MQRQPALEGQRGVPTKLVVKANPHIEILGLAEEPSFLGDQEVAVIFHGEDGQEYLEDEVELIEVSEIQSYSGATI